MALRTIGGGLVGADGKPIQKKAGTDVEDGASFRDVKLGVNGPFTRTTVGRGSSAGGHSEQGEGSDEEILDGFKRSQMQRKLSDVEGRERIVVTETYRVERS